MPRKATKDTYGYQTVAGVEIRHQIKAGSNVASVYERFDDDDAIEETDEPATKLDVSGSNVAGEGSSPSPASGDDDDDDGEEDDDKQGTKSRRGRGKAR